VLYHFAWFNSGAERKEAAESTINAYKVALGNLTKIRVYFCVFVEIKDILLCIC
jgi:hypothetical protein